MIQFKYAYPGKFFLEDPLPDHQAVKPDYWFAQKLHAMRDFLFIKLEKNYYKLKLSEILYIQAEKKYVNIVTAAKSHLVLTSISQIEKLLPKDLFCRIHRSYIISLEHTTRFNCEFVYIENKKIPVSEHYRNVLKSSVIILASGISALRIDMDDIDKYLTNIGI